MQGESASLLDLETTPAQEIKEDRQQLEEALEVDQETFGPQTLRDFDVDLENFQGPFDLLLRLIARKDLDVTEVALADVTEEFLAYMRSSPDLSSATDFLVVAATLLDMKAAALLPKLPGQEPSEEDLEARDLLFARLLQYRGFKRASALLKQKWNKYSGGVARLTPLEEPFTRVLSPLVWKTSTDQLAEIAARVLGEAPRPDLADHVARPAASLEEQLQILTGLLSEEGKATFTQLTSDASSVAVIVVRFLGLLELYRRGAVGFHQKHPMGKLTVTWLGEEEN